MRQTTRRVLFGSKREWNVRIRRTLDTSRYIAEYIDDNPARHDPAGFDLFVPQDYRDHEMVWKRGLTNALAPARETVWLASDKKKFNAWLAENRFDAALPRLFSRAPEFPCILKKSRDAFGRYSRIVSSQADLELLLQDENFSDAFLQELIPGRTEYTAHFLARNGDILFATTLAFSFDSDIYVKGTRLFGELTGQTDRVPAVIRRIVGQLGYTGIGCFNYKLVDGMPKIFELNPRFGASLSLVINPFMAAYETAIIKP